MGLFDEEYWNTFNQQNQSDNLHAETGENSQRQSGMSGQIRNTPKTGTTARPSNPHDRLSRSRHTGEFRHHETPCANGAGRRL